MTTKAPPPPVRTFFDPPYGLFEDGTCGCYPECRNDCQHSARCYASMPEYWPPKERKLRQAQQYAAEVRARKGMGTKHG